MSINPVFMSPGASFISLSPIFISQSSLLSCWNASGSLLTALNSWCISMHALFGLLRSLRCLFPCVLVVSCGPYLFLASFIYIPKFITMRARTRHTLNAKLFGSHFWCPIQTWLCFWARECAAEGSWQNNNIVSGTLLGTCREARGTAAWMSEFMMWPVRSWALVAQLRGPWHGCASGRHCAQLPLNVAGMLVGAGLAARGTMTWLCFCSCHQSTSLTT